LTPKGKKQAESLGISMFGTPASNSADQYSRGTDSSTPSAPLYDAIYCSDLTRVIETATIALSYSNNRYSMDNVTLSPLLREKNAGIYEGKLKR
jgi:broad specificity phosphatase PhoE